MGMGKECQGGEVALETSLPPPPPQSILCQRPGSGVPPLGDWEVKGTAFERLECTLEGQTLFSIFLPVNSWSSLLNFPPPHTTICSGERKRQNDSVLLKHRP